MSLYRLCKRPISRCNGQPTTGAFAYRAGEKLEYDGNIYDYTWRQDIIYTEIILPESAPREYVDRQTLWSAAEKAEDSSRRWKTARTAHEIIIALPRVLTFDTSIIMVKELIDTCFIPLGMCADFAVHRGDKKYEIYNETDHKGVFPHNPHGHITLPTRYVEPNGFSNNKAREWDSWGNPAILIQWRKEWQDIQNRMFERKGINTRVSHEKQHIGHEHSEKQHNHDRDR